MEKNGNNQRKLLLVVAAAAIFLGGVVWYFIATAGRVTTDDAYVDGHIHTVAPRVVGNALRVYVQDNQAVKAGDLLAELDPKDYDLRVAEAQAALEAERSKLLDAQATIGAAQAGLRLARVALDQAGRDKRRAQSLFKDGVLSREKYEKALTAYDLAKSQWVSGYEQLKKARSQDILEEAQIKLKEATLHIAELNREYTRITAPADGYVTRKGIEVGNQIQAGQPILAVVALGDVWVTANFKETQLKNVKSGQRVLIKIDTFPGRAFTGRVDSVMAGTGAAFSLFPPENALGNYVKVVQRVPVKITLDLTADVKHVLRVGMSCVPTILTHDD